MVGNRSVSRPNGTPCWSMVATLAFGTFLLMVLASPISADEANGSPYLEAYSEEGENLTTPATPLRQFVWRVRNWMFRRNDEDTNIEVDATEAVEPTTGEKVESDSDGVLSKPRSWVRSLAAWFARGIRNLLEQLHPSGDGAAGGNTTETAVAQDGTGNPDDKPKDNNSEDTVIKPNRHVFRPWTALPPPPPPGMTASPPDITSTTDSVSSSGSSPGYVKPSTTLGSKDSKIGSKGGKSATAGGKSSSDATTSSIPPKKPKRRRPKQPSTSTSTTDMPPSIPPVSTEEAFIQDSGNNEI